MRAEKHQQADNESVLMMRMFWTVSWLLIFDVWILFDDDFANVKISKSFIFTFHSNDV